MHAETNSTREAYFDAFAASLAAADTYAIALTAEYGRNHNDVATDTLHEAYTAMMAADSARRAAWETYQTARKISRGLDGKATLY